MNSARANFLPILALLLLSAPSRADESGVFKSEDLNFQIRTPEDSVDWDSMEIDNEKHKTLRVWFHSPFADTDAYASVQVHVQKMHRSQVRRKLEKIAEKWKESLEIDLTEKRDRKDGIEEWAGVETYKAELMGNLGAGIHRRRWFLLRNGQLIYTIIVDQHLKQSIEDEYVNDEIKQILGSFKFGEIRKLEADRKAKKAEAPGGAAGSGGGPIGDPEKLKEAPVEMDFWRFKAVKPANIQEMPLSKNDIENSIKVQWVGEINTIRLGIRLYVWSLKSKVFTLDKLADSRIENFKKRVKDMKKPEVNKNYERNFPLADKAYYINLIGRTTRRERWTYILAECENDRQYMIEVYSMGDTGDKVWGKTIEKFLKSFQPQKK